MSPGNTAQLLSALASPAWKREFLRTTENDLGCPPPSQSKDYRSFMHTQHKDGSRDRGFWKMLHKRHAHLNGRCWRSAPLSASYDEVQICGLRLSPVSGISALMELWPSG